MNISETIKKLDFDIQQIDNTIDILNYFLDGEMLSSNGKRMVDTNLKSLCEVQHHLLSLRANLLKQQNNISKTL